MEVSLELERTIAENSKKHMMPQRRVFRVGSRIWRVVGLRVRVKVVRVLVGIGKHLSDVKIPSVSNNEFNKWFDNLSAKEFEEMWNNPQVRSKIEDRIRRPGGYHEWHLVARTLGN